MDSTVDRYRSVGAHAKHARDVVRVVEEELEKPDRHAEQRRWVTRELIGEPDGKVSERIADYLLGVS